MIVASYLYCNYDIIYNCCCAATCWAIVLTRLLQAIFNINQTHVANYKTFLYEDLVSHLKPDTKKKGKGKKPTSLALNNIQAALKHMRKEGLLKVKASGTTKVYLEHQFFSLLFRFIIFLLQIFVQ